MSTIKLAPTRSQSAARWRAACQAHIRSGNIKRADLGGGDSVPFESAFSNLAHAYLKDRAPQLLDHELGFQLLEKNEDNDRAIGVFGFKVGPQLLYGPVFFLNGELKGHELLYLKDSDTFVPMKENWINYVLGRKPNVIGEEMPPQPALLGVDRPSMDVFRESPQNKYGTAHPEWLLEGLPGLMYALGRVERLENKVPELVKSSAFCAKQLVALLGSYPQLAKPICDCYGPEMVKVAIAVARTEDSICPIEPPRKPHKVIRGSVLREKTAEQIRREQDPIHTGELTIHVQNGKRATGLKGEQLEKLARDGILIEDNRKDASRAYIMHKKAVEDDPSLSLMNPDDTGIYTVLCHPDAFERCLFIHSPHGARGPKVNGVLIRLDEGNKAWTETHPSAIFVEEEYEPEKYREWFNGLPDATSLQEGATYVLLALNGQGTGVFEVEKTMPAEGEEKCYQVYWRNRWGARRPDHLPPVAERRYEHDSDTSGPDHVVLNRIKGTRFVSRFCNLLVPTDAKALKIKDPPKPDPDEPCCSPCCDEYDSSDPPALRPGNHVDIQLGIYKTSAAMKVLNNGTEAVINNARMSPKSALITLVKDYGLREKTAREILKQANLKRGIKFFVKLAQPYNEMLGGPTAPTFPEPLMGTDSLMGSGVPAIEPEISEMPVDGLQSLQSRPLMAPQAEPMMQDVAQAAQTGQKEVLDTSLLSNLLRGSQNETLIDKHLPDLMKGLDSLGRLLFNLYWHHDSFEERYGSGNLPDMEDALRNAFENLGDITLELKQKTIEPYPDEGVDVDIGEGE